MSNKKQNEEYRKPKEALNQIIKNINCEISQMTSAIRAYMLLNPSNHISFQDTVLDDFLNLVTGLEFRITANVLYVSYTLGNAFWEESYRLYDSNTNDDLTNITALLNHISELFVKKRQSCFCMMNNAGLVPSCNEADFIELFSIENIIKFCIELL